VTNLLPIKWAALHRIPITISAHSVGYQPRIKPRRQHFRPEVSHSIPTYYDVCRRTAAFSRWTDEEHRRLGEDYHLLSTPTARKNFVKEHATRYSELSHLPYFDMVEQVVIDPMHNLFLGLSSHPPGSYYALT